MEQYSNFQQRNGSWYYFKNRANLLIIKYVALMTVFCVLIIGCGTYPKFNKLYENEEFVYQRFSNGIYITSYKGINTDVVIPSEIDNIPVVGIGRGGFENKGLTNIIIPNSVHHIERNAFSGNQLTSIIIHETVSYRAGVPAHGIPPSKYTKIDEYAFSKNQLTSIIIHENTSIADNAFRENQITEVKINHPNRLKAFSGNPISKIIIGDGTTYDMMNTWYSSFSIPEFNLAYSSFNCKGGEYELIDGVWCLNNEKPKNIMFIAPTGFKIEFSEKEIYRWREKNDTDYYILPAGTKNLKIRWENRDYMTGMGQVTEASAEFTNVSFNGVGGHLYEPEMARNSTQGRTTYVNFTIRDINTK